MVGECTVCSCACRELSGQLNRHWVQLRWHLGRGRRRKERREVQRGCSPLLTSSTQQLTGAGCHPSAWFLPEVSKSSCHEQLTEFAFQVGKPGINKSNAKCHEQTHVTAACYSNILLPVSSRAESICFLLCLLFCKHYGGYRCQKTTLTSPYPGTSLVSPRLPPALCWHSHLRGSWVKVMEELLT